MTEALPRRLRMWAYGNLFIGGLEGLARGLGRLPRNQPERHGVQVTRDLAYRDGGDSAHLLDVYRPAGVQGPLPAAIYIHGGGFKYFDKDTHWSLALGLARRGMVVFTLNYRLAPSHRYPAAVQDVADALLWIHRHGPAFGADLSRMVWAGESAGGNLALGLTISACWRRPEPWARAVWETGLCPRVLLPACGYLEVSRPERHARERPIPRWMNDRIELVSADWLPDHAHPVPDHAYANPLVILEQSPAPDRPLPATLAIVGDRDPVMGDTLRLGAEIERRGVAGGARVYPGGIHAFHAFGASRLGRQAWADQYAFIDRHLDPSA